MPSIFDMHVHTNQGSVDSGLSPQDMVKEAKRIGLTGLVLAEHQGWPNKEEFKRFAAEQDIVLIHALEIDTNMGHIVVYGLNSYPNGYSDIRQLRKTVLDAGGYMVSAHPFRFLFDPSGEYTRSLLYPLKKDVPEYAEGAVSHPIFSLVDEIEVVNGANNEKENRFTQDVVRLLGRQGTGGSDAHSTHGLGKGVTLFEADLRSESDFLSALREGAFSPYEGFHVGKPEIYA